MRKISVAVVLVLLAGGVAGFVQHAHSAVSKGHAKGEQAMPVQVAVAHVGNMAVQLNELGTVTPRHTVTITPRVDGLLQHVLFREGQTVKAGQVLETLDPRPFQVVVDQWVGQLEHDQALLDDAKLDLTRYQGLLARDSIGSQQVDTQKALVKQYEGTVASDRGQLANARLQLEFSRVTAPVTGRVGLRLIDEGNMVHAAQTNGLVLITQTQPIDVVFAIPAEQLATVLQAGRDLPVEVYDQSDLHRLASGKLLAIDNQINTTTGTVNLKATFANRDDRLFPNEFVNVHLQAGSLQHVILVPLAAVQTGAKGAYVYVVAQDHVVHLRPVTEALAAGETAAIRTGLAEGEVVVTDGVDRLHEGSLVTTGSAETDKAHHHPGRRAADGKAGQ